MSQYIETRPEAIKAIYKAITEKWNLICMGLDVRHTVKCPLCEMYRGSGRGCVGKKECPLDIAGDNCWDNKSTFSVNWGEPEGDKAMLEALVQLLPESERAIYGG